jgi:hypothetical protein
VKDDLFRAFGADLPFFTTNNKEHRGTIINILGDYNNIHNVALYEETIEKLYRLFPKLQNSTLSRHKSSFTDRFKPIMLFGSSEEFLQEYLNLHPEINITPSLVKSLDRKGLFNRMTSSIITCYLDHSYRQEQKLSRCHTSEDWGILKFVQTNTNENTK